MSDGGSAFITQDSLTSCGQEVARGGGCLLGIPGGIKVRTAAPEFSHLGHTAAHYSTDIIGSTALTTFHCTAPF